MKFLALNVLFLCKTLSVIYLDSSYSEKDSDGSYSKPFSDSIILHNIINNSSAPKTTTIFIKNIVSISQTFVLKNKTLIFLA